MASEQTTHNLLMGEWKIVEAPNGMRITLGSCVAIILVEKGTGKWACAHAMLPSRPTGNMELGKPIEEGKYVDSAIEIMSKLFPSKLGVYGFLIGGSNMFSHLGAARLMNVGQQNIEKAVAGLKAKGILISGEDLGGTKGRMVRIDTVERKIWITKIGEKQEMVFQVA